MFFNRIRSTNSLIKCLSANIIQYQQKALPNLNYCTSVETKENINVQPKKAISKAMKAYLERAHEHNEFMAKKKKEFEIGKRHLANMMGEDPENFTQEDINNAIEYLFPSGLFDPKARPFMRPPEEVYPQRKAAEFDESGRPYHFLFYTSKSNFYNILYDIVEHMNQLEKYEDKMIKNNVQPDPNLILDMSGYKWIEKEVLEKRMVESIHDRDYNLFVNAIDRLSKMTYSYQVKDFILNYCESLISQTKISDIPKLKYDADGRAYITTYECLRKTARGDVTIRSPGTGLISINGQDIRYFTNLQSKEQLLFPLIFTDMLGKVDIEANVAGGGPSSQAGAIRWGIAQGLRCFVDEDMLEKMRIAGLLTRDYRTKERKKPGQAGARKKFTWKKR